MNTKQIIAFLVPILLVGVMYPVFQLLGRKFGGDVGWYLGLVIYWLIWGAAYPLSMLGKETILNLIRPQKVGTNALLLAAIPLLFAAIGRVWLGMQYEKDTSWALYALLATAVGNGFFEELLWRGTYMALFPDNGFYRIIWPSLWFALWHYAPGSVSSDGNVLGLMIGAAFFGLYLGYLAKHTNTLWWSILAHTLAGIVMVV